MIQFRVYKKRLQFRTLVPFLACTGDIVLSRDWTDWTTIELKGIRI